MVILSVCLPASQSHLCTIFTFTLQLTSVSCQFHELSYASRSKRESLPNFVNRHILIYCSWSTVKCIHKTPTMWVCNNMALSCLKATWDRPCVVIWHAKTLLWISQVICDRTAMQFVCTCTRQCFNHTH